MIENLKEDEMVGQPRKTATAKPSAKGAKPTGKNPAAKKPGAGKAAAAVAKKVTIASVSPTELIIGGDPTFVYLNGSGFDLFKPKNPNDPPTGRFEAYILKSGKLVEEDEKFIEVIQPISSSITDTKFPIEVTVLLGAAPGARRVGIRNKADKFSDCDKKESCFVTPAAVIALK